MKTAAEKPGLKPGLQGWVTGGVLPGFEAEVAGVPDIMLAFVADRAAIRVGYRDEIRSLTRKADWPGMA